MPIVLTPVAYGLNSPNVAAQMCLATKRNAVLNFTGVGPHSCCACVMYWDRAGNSTESYGVSRGKTPFVRTGQQRAACSHGELTALWDAVEEYDGIPTISQMYIELHPCNKCLEWLNTNLNGVTVYYSFNYDQPGIAAWKAAATQLCQP